MRKERRPRQNLEEMQHLKCIREKWAVKAVGEKPRDVTKTKERVLQ